MGKSENCMSYTAIRIHSTKHKLMEHFQEDIQDGFATVNFTTYIVEGVWHNGVLRKGKITFLDNGAIYEGDLEFTKEAGKANGCGVLRTTCGKVYEGIWEDNDLIEGALIHKTDKYSLYYKGDFVSSPDSIIPSREGEGFERRICIEHNTDNCCNNGSVYMGKFMNDKYCGKGRLISRFYEVDGVFFHQRGKLKARGKYKEFRNKGESRDVDLLTDDDVVTYQGGEYMVNDYQIFPFCSSVEMVDEKMGLRYQGAMYSQNDYTYGSGTLAIKARVNMLNQNLQVVQIQKGDFVNLLLNEGIIQCHISVESSLIVSTRYRGKYLNDKTKLYLSDVCSICVEAPDSSFQTFDFISNFGKSRPSNTKYTDKFGILQVNHLTILGEFSGDIEYAPSVREILSCRQHMPKLSGGFVVVISDFFILEGYCNDDGLEDIRNRKILPPYMIFSKNELWKKSIFLLETFELDKAYEDLRSNYLSKKKEFDTATSSRKRTVIPLKKPKVTKELMINYESLMKTYKHKSKKGKIETSVSPIVDSASASASVSAIVDSAPAPSFVDSASASVSAIVDSAEDVETGSSEVDTSTESPDSTIELWRNVRQKVFYKVYVMIDFMNLYAENHAVNFETIDQMIIGDRYMWVKQKIATANSSVSHLHPILEELDYELPVRKFINVSTDERGREQGVDECITSYIMQWILRVKKKAFCQNILILLTGDGNENEGRPSIYEAVEDALEHDWKVELYGRDGTVNPLYKKLRFRYPHNLKITVF